EVEGDVGEAGRAHGVGDLSPAGQHGLEVGRVDLEAGHLAVVAHTELGIAKRVEGGLGAVYRAEPAQGDGRAVREARGQAGGGRLVPGAQAERLGPVADVVFGEARGD